jgi:hypothetical protein
MIQHVYLHTKIQPNFCVSYWGIYLCATRWIGKSLTRHWQQRIALWFGGGGVEMTSNLCAKVIAMLFHQFISPFSSLFLFRLIFSLPHISLSLSLSLSCPVSNTHTRTQKSITSCILRRSISI